MPDRLGMVAGGGMDMYYTSDIQGMIWSEPDLAAVP